RRSSQVRGAAGLSPDQRPRAGDAARGRLAGGRREQGAVGSGGRCSIPRLRPAGSVRRRSPWRWRATGPRTGPRSRLSWPAPRCWWWAQRARSARRPCASSWSFGRPGWSWSISTRTAWRGGRAAIGFNALDFAGFPGLALAEAAGPFDLVLNFAAVKHVRSEKNRFTLLHMIDVNVVRQRRFTRHLAAKGLARRHFVVSTDKAADPASFMGATKLLLEGVAFAAASDGAGAPTATAARFANVAYSSGSLLESYVQRFEAGQALAAPKDTRRYFIAARDAARICLLA